MTVSAATPSEHRLTALFRGPDTARQAVRKLERMGIQPDELSVPIDLASEDQTRTDRYADWFRHLRQKAAIGSTILAVVLMLVLDRVGNLDTSAIAAVLIASALAGAAWARSQLGESSAWRATFRTPPDQPVKAVIESDRGISVTEAAERLWSMSPLDLVRG